MQQNENQQANFEDEQTVRGGSAPEHRRCRYTKADGKGCRDWAVRGQELCYRHGVFLRAGRGIDVPLLEDEASIVLVLSETLRAVAQGTIALKSGSLLLEGCRLAHTMHMEKQKAANAERKRRRTGVREDEMGEETQEPGAGSEEPEAGLLEPGTGRQERVPHICPGLADVGEHDPILARTVSPEPNQEPGAPPFRDLEKNWDKDLSNVEREATDRFDPRYEETREGVLAAQAEQLDERGGARGWGAVRRPARRMARNLRLASFPDQSRADQREAAIAPLWTAASELRKTTTPTINPMGNPPAAVNPSWMLWSNINRTREPK